MQRPIKILDVQVNPVVNKFTTQVSFVFAKTPKRKRHCVFEITNPIYMDEFECAMKSLFKKVRKTYAQKYK